MVIILDFDRTLFDKEKFFKKDLPDYMNVERKKFLKTYEENFKDRETNMVDYDFEKHLEILEGKNKIAKKNIDKLFNNLDEYLVPGAIKLLNFFKKRGDEMFLVTLGNKKWQKRKVDGVKVLSKYFDKKHIIFSQRDKNKNLEKLKNINAEFIIINDKVEESLEMNKTLGGNNKIFIVSSEFSKNSAYKGRIYKNLHEIKKELFNIQ